MGEVVLAAQCRQVCIGSPRRTLDERAFKFDAPEPEVPISGARIRIIYVGACYKEGALFPGYELAGTIDVIGKDAERPDGITEGSRVVLYPYQSIPTSYSEYIVVPDFKRLVPVPDELPLSVAAMLPTGALLVINSVYMASVCLERLQDSCDEEKANVLIVGPGSLALWALRIINHYYKNGEFTDKANITVATLDDEGFMAATQHEEVNSVQWYKNWPQRPMIDRTVAECGGLVDIVINLDTSAYAFHSSLQCLDDGGIVLVTERVGDRFWPTFARRAENRDVNVIAVPNGTIEQLKELVELVTIGEIEPPVACVYLTDEADIAESILSRRNFMRGRALLKYHHADFEFEVLQS